ncbi:hypothetical protein IIW_00984 [Bacillus cereus VD136]|nr:hypothetical protein IIW_00984 [Bacillus cereus VD136]EOP72908.1 hypothetical protein KOW_00318 [Bacillus cereus VDM006]
MELIVSPPYAVTIPESIWDKQQIIKQYDDGTIYIQATMRGRKYIVKWILGMGSSVMVMGLQKNKKCVLKQVRAILMKCNI